MHKLPIDLPGPNLACDTRPVVYAYRFDVIWMGVLCQLPMLDKNAKILQFRPILTFWGARVPIPIYWSAQIWQETVYPRSMFTRWISLESIYSMTFQGRKTAILVRCWYSLPVRANQFGLLTCQISYWSVYSVTLERRKAPNFAVFRIGHFVVSSVPVLELT